MSDRGLERRHLPPRPDEGVLREVFEYGFTRLDPVGGAHIDPPSVAVYETLLRKGPGGVALPGLASSWEESSDGLSCRVSLREGARFHSGRPCDAAAVLEALERCRYGPVDGLRQIWYWDPVESVRALDSSTIELRLLFPYRRIPTLLWGTHTGIYNDRRRQSLGEEFGRSEADGTGTYRMVSFSPSKVVAERLSPPPGGVERIEWFALREEAERAAVLEDASADVLRAPPFDLVEALVDDPRWNLARVKECSQIYLGLNFECQQFDFHLREMRAAIEAAIDREALVERVFSGYGDSRRSPVPAADPLAETWNPDDGERLAFDQAEAVLDRLGWQRDSSGCRSKNGVALSFECVAENSPVFKRLTAELGQQLARLGVNLNFVYAEPFEEFYAACDNKPPSFVNKWLWQDPIEAIQGFSRSDCACEGSPNWQSSRIPSVDAAFDDFLRARYGRGHACRCRPAAGGLHARVALCTALRAGGAHGDAGRPPRLRARRGNPLPLLRPGRSRERRSPPLLRGATAAA